MSETSVNVWTTPDGIQFAIPADIYAATTFRKDGWPDKRVKANAAFWQWLAKQPSPNARVEGVEAIVELAQTEMRAGVEIAAMGSTQINPAQTYALRVWNGQSESADRPWRIQRVKEALEGQGLSFDGVTLPDQPNNRHR